jgi:hypothetical protein
MNLHAIVSGNIQAINPYIQLIVQISTGYATNPDGSRVPSYAPNQIVFGDVQALQYNDIVQLDALNIQGERRKIYINGEVDGLIRVENKGGDLITTPDGNVWLVALVLEYWSQWVSVAVTLQDQIDLCP